VEVAIELDVDLATVVEGDLHLVVALLVAGLGLGDRAAADVVKRDLAGPFESLAADRRVAGVVVTGRSAQPVWSFVVYRRDRS